MFKDLVLAGDIGGTKSNLAFFHGSPKTPEMVVERTYQNREFGGLREVVRHFLADTGLAASTACFGVAGAVVAGKSHLPNLGWDLSETALSRELGIGIVDLVNDLEATALGLGTLAPEQFFSLNPGQERTGGNRAIIAAGTGLGMAMLLPEGLSSRVVASEGGHADFAPRSEEEVALWHFLKARHGHVSMERVVSGQGLVNIYEFLRHGSMTEPAWLSTQLDAAADRAAVIAQLGMDGEADICVKTLDMFLTAYGAAAGNLALMAMSTGGLYIGGGIAPKLIEAFPQSNFMTAFTDKGRFGGMLRDVPVRIALEPRTALLGAASRALWAL